MHDSCTQKEFIILFSPPKVYVSNPKGFKFSSGTSLSSQFMSMYSCEEASLGALALETAALLPEAVAEALRALEAAARST